VQVKENMPIFVHLESNRMGGASRWCMARVLGLKEYALSEEIKIIFIHFHASESKM